MSKPKTIAASKRVRVWKPRKGSQRIYNIWRGMRSRCYDPAAKDFYRYGGRGITICVEWQNFATFEQWALANGYADDLTIERKKNERGYSSSNCKWATKREQSNNTRTNIEIAAFGEVKTLRNWARDPRCVVSYKTLLDRLHKNWADGDEIVTTPHERTRRLITAFGETKSPTEWAEDPRCKVDKDRLYVRVFKRGWNPEIAITLAPELGRNQVSGHITL